MKLIVQKGKMYLAEDVNSQQIISKFMDSILSREYTAGFDLPFTAFTPIAAADNFFITLKTYPKTISTPLIMNNVAFDGPFMLHMVDDIEDRIKSILRIAQSWITRKEDYYSIPIPENSTTEEISASPLLTTAPPQLYWFPKEYFERLMGFEEEFLKIRAIFEKNEKIVSNYVLEISDLVRGFFAIEKANIEKPPCVQEVEIEENILSIEIPFSTGSILVYSTTIDKGPLGIFKTFRIEPKVFGAVDFELFLLEFARRKQEVEKTIEKTLERAGISNKDVLNQFMDYYLSLTSIATSTDEIGSIAINIPKMPRGDVFVRIMGNDLQFLAETTDCEKGKEKIEEIQSLVYFTLLGP